MHERMSHVKESEKICEPFSVWRISSDVAPKGLWGISSDPQLCVWKEHAIRSVEQRMCSFTPPVWKLGKFVSQKSPPVAPQPCCRVSPGFSLISQDLTSSWWLGISQSARLICQTAVSVSCCFFYIKCSGLLLTWVQTPFSIWKNSNTLYKID